MAGRGGHKAKRMNAVGYKYEKSKSMAENKVIVKEPCAKALMKLIGI